MTKLNREILDFLAKGREIHSRPSSSSTENLRVEFYYVDDINDVVVNGVSYSIHHERKIAAWTSDIVIYFYNNDIFYGEDILLRIIRIKAFV